MKKFLLGGAVALCGFASHAQAADCDGAAISGMLVGGTAGACYYAKVNSDGSVPVTTTPSATPGHVIIDSGILTTLTNPLAAGGNVIGHVINDTGSTTAVTGNVTVVQPTGINLHAVLDTTSTTAVTQPTAANLNATVVGTGTFATQSAQSGTWTVQPGNTANTTAWKVDGSAVTQPVSAASLPLPTGAGTAANQATINTSLGTINTTLGTPMQSSGGTVTPLPSTGSGTFSWGGNFTTSSAILINSSNYRYMFIQNVSATASVACALGVTAVLNSGTSFMLPPLASRTWEGSYVPTVAVNCIASASSTPIYAETR